MSSHLHTLARVACWLKAFLLCSPSACIQRKCSSSLSSPPLRTGVCAPRGHPQSTCVGKSISAASISGALSWIPILTNSWLCLTLPGGTLGSLQGLITGLAMRLGSASEVVHQGQTAALGAIPVDTGHVTTLTGRDGWPTKQGAGLEELDSSFTPGAPESSVQFSAGKPFCLLPVKTCIRPRFIARGLTLLHTHCLFYRWKVCHNPVLSRSCLCCFSSRVGSPIVCITCRSFLQCFKPFHYYTFDRDL